MTDILHRIGVEQSSPEQVYDALTTIDGLSGWWTEDTTGSTDLGGVIEFRFGRRRRLRHEGHRARSRAGSSRWEVVDGPEEWIGTTVDWELRQDGECTIVLFKHEGWREPVEFMYHCSTKWATFLMSLKQLRRDRRGRPRPARRADQRLALTERNRLDDRSGARRPISRRVRVGRTGPTEPRSARR